MLFQIGERNKKQASNRGTNDGSVLNYGLGVTFHLYYLKRKRKN